MYFVFIVRCILLASTICRFLHQHSLSFPFFVGCLSVSISSSPDFQPLKEKARGDMHVTSILFYSCSSVFGGKGILIRPHCLDFLAEILKISFQLGQLIEWCFLSCGFQLEDLAGNLSVTKPLLLKSERAGNNEVLRKGLVFFKHGRMEGCCGLNLRYHFQSVAGLHFSELDPAPERL